MSGCPVAVVPGIRINAVLNEHQNNCETRMSSQRGQLQWSPAAEVQGTGMCVGTKLEEDLDHFPMSILRRRPSGMQRRAGVALSGAAVNGPYWMIHF